MSDVSRGPHESAVSPNPFTDYLRESTESLRRTVELQTELTKRISLGDIAPVVVESRMAAFLGHSGGKYLSEVTEVAANFLARLIALNARQARDLVRFLDPEAVLGASPDPPRFDGDPSTDWTVRLQEYAASETRALSERRSSGDDGATLTPQPVPELVDMLLEAFAQVGRIQSEYGARFLESVLELARAPHPVDAVVRAVAPLGSPAEAFFAVTNNTSESADVRCSVSDVRRCDGVGPTIRPDVVIMPERFALSPDHEEVLHLSVPLSPRLFTAGAAYTGSIRVTGVGAATVDIPLEIRASVPDVHQGLPVEEAP